MADKKRIAVLGGGMGSLAAVYALLADPISRESYDVTVYQQGWRLGGKGASGVNADVHNRIEEHGLHVFLGFYHKALSLMRRCYRDLNSPDSPGEILRDPSAPLGSFEQAFRPHNQILLYHKIRGGWRKYPIRFPANHRQPGNLDARRSLLALARWLAGALGSVKRALIGAETGAKRDAELILDLERTRALVLKIETIRPGEFEEIRRTRDEDAVGGPDAVYRELASLEGRIESNLRTTRCDRGRLQRMLEYYRSYIALALVNLRGMWADVVFSKNGFEGINEYDYIEWLKRHGAARAAIDSPLALSLYELAFARPGSAARGDGFAAGVVLKSTLRMLFDYEGAFMWKMQAGMGDTVFAPVYQVLRRWGVRFEFFHQVEGLRLCGEKTYVDAVDLLVQAKTRGAVAYEPLVDVDGLACWPSRPGYEQLLQGEGLAGIGINFESWNAKYPPELDPPDKLTIRRGLDFDFVVLGISLAALGERRVAAASGEFRYRGICQELFAASLKWRTMFEKLRTIATQALQIWMKTPPADDTRSVIGGYEKPFQTCMDMSHLLQRESWPKPGPGSLVYFCGPLEERRQHSKDRRTHRERAREWLFRRGGEILPRISGRSGAFDPGLLYRIEETNSPENSSEARFDFQYYRTNQTGSERYVLSVPGSTEHRLPVKDEEFLNLYVVGDWVKSEINAGCIEACVASGFEFAHSISGRPVRL